MDCCADEDAVVKRPEECDKEADKARNQIDPFKILFSRQTRQHKFLLLLFQIGMVFSYLLLLSQIGWMTWCSTLNITAVMMTAASTAWW